MKNIPVVCEMCHGWISFYSHSSRKNPHPPPDVPRPQRRYAASRRSYIPLQKWAISSSVLSILWALVIFSEIPRGVINTTPAVLRTALVFLFLSSSYTEKYKQARLKILNVLFSNTCYDIFCFVSKSFWNTNKQFDIWPSSYSPSTKCISLSSAF